MEIIAVVSKAKKTLTDSILWARYAALLTFVGLGIELFQIIFGFINGAQGIVTVLLKFFFTSIFSLISAINLYNFSKFAKHGIETMNAKYLFQSFRHLKIFFIVLGISIIVLSTLFILSLILFILLRLNS